jgi:hypothetical protein
MLGFSSSNISVRAETESKRDRETERSRERQRVESTERQRLRETEDGVK